MKVTIAGVGHYVPGDPVTNEELIARHRLRVKPYFISRHVGIETRHFAAPDQATSDLAVEAGARAILASGLHTADIRRVIVATVSGDYTTPATACVVQHRLGLSKCGAIDVVGACAGFVQALDLAARCVATGSGPTLVIGADVRSRQVDFSDLRTAFLYGDGAAAVVVVPSGTDGLLHSILVADGRGVEAVYIPCGGSREPNSAATLRDRRDRITMANGRAVASAARAGFRALADRLVAESGVAWNDIAFHCMHQPNLMLLREVCQDLRVAEERTWINFPRYGNTTSASVPLALSEASERGCLVDGALVSLSAVGAGFAGGIQLLRWGAR